MSFEVDEDIMQDFLVEAGEILEQLQEQLVELENNPENADLLNAIFRGYHTVKGGAGFLALTELVEICHGAENVFDVMRNGQRALTPELMDVILQATDVVVDMFESVKRREALEAASPSLIEVLHKLSKPEQADEEIFSTTHEQSKPSEAQVEAINPIQAGADHNIDEISEDEFEALLDELHGENNSPAKVDKTVINDSNTDDASDTDISDDEFEALLDELHGEGSFKTDASAISSKDKVDTTATEPSKGDDDEISEDEFEALLDNLHGKGKGPAPVESKPEAKKPKADTTQSSMESSTTNSTKSTVAKSANTKESNSNETAKESTAVPASKTQSTNKPIPAKAAAKKADSKAAPPAETTVRVDTKRLDQIMNMVGELVLVRNRLISLGINLADESMSKAIANLDVVTGDLQGAVMKTRMQPIKKVFGRFPRVVRDLARTLKKDISLVLEGEDTDLDKNLVEALADPLVHLVRNSVDHGIEMPDEREASGKPRMGTVKLAASQEGDHILLTIADDGKGMDAEKLKQIAIERGVLDSDSAARMSDVEAFNLIFAPGFSTKTEISDISGRGVGMDVVKTKINQLNGAVSINSSLGEGTTLEIKVPLTLAILPTLMIVVSDQTFALPLGSVNEIINLDVNKTNTVDNQLTMIVRSKAIPLFYLNDWLNPHRPSENRLQGHVVVVQIGPQQIGFVVDSLIGQEEVVIKPLDSLLQGTPGMAGATITSDGGIALILDIPGLIKRNT
jgi:two-component system chemotaxis sensor kinase CheA